MKSSDMTLLQTREGARTARPEHDRDERSHHGDAQVFAVTLAMHERAASTSQVAPGRVYPEFVAPERVVEPVLACVRDGVPQLEVRLHPPELGPMTLTVSLTDRLVHLDMQAACSSAAERLRASVRTLADTLAQRGLRLAACDVRVAAKTSSRKESSP